jgi:chemotaxis protein methyltransferase CheR
VHEPRPPTADLLTKALGDADAGRLDEAIQSTDALLRTDPLDADAQFVRGVAELQRGNATAAIDSLRRALYVDPGFALAAFKLGRAYDAIDDPRAAKRAYRQALQTLAPGHERQRRLAPDIDLADIAAACSARLTAIGKPTNS